MTSKPEGLHPKQMICSTCYYAYNHRIQPLIYDNEKFEWKHKNGNGNCLREPEAVRVKDIFHFSKEELAQ